MRFVRLRRRLLRFAFRLLYNEMAWTYDSVAWLISTGLWWTWQQAAIPHLTGPRVLEIATGTGRLLPELHARGFRVVGLDLSPHMIRIARRRLEARRLALPLCQASAEALPFASGSFDSLVTTFPTPFIREDRVLAEISRVLAPRGRLIVVQHGAVLQPRFLAGAIEWLYGATDQPGGDAESPAHWLRQAGWTVRDVRAPRPRSVAYVVVANPPYRPSDSPPVAFGI